MSNKCAGVWGWLFGHCFFSHLTKHTPPVLNHHSTDAIFWGSLSIADTLSTREYEVRCKRCGKKPE